MSNTATSDDQCPACGGLGAIVWVGEIHLCRLCAKSDNLQNALAIVQHRHADRLKAILADLESAAE